MRAQLVVDRAHASSSHIRITRPQRYYCYTYYGCCCCCYCYCSLLIQSLVSMCTCEDDDRICVCVSMAFHLYILCHSLVLIFAPREFSSLSFSANLCVCVLPLLLLLLFCWFIRSFVCAFFSKHYIYLTVLFLLVISFFKFNTLAGLLMWLGQRRLLLYYSCFFVYGLAVLFMFIHC